MLEFGLEQDYQRAAAMREAVWKLLDEHLHLSSEERDPKVIVGLQDAANQLGAVEQRLRDGQRAARHGRLPDPHSPALDEHGLGALDRPIAAEAAIVLALADVFVPRSATSADEAERWLHIMCEHGAVGSALRALGMSAGQLATPSVPRGDSDSRERRVVIAIAADAAELCARRGARMVATVDVLFAVISHYGRLFDRALYATTSKQRSDLLAELVGRGLVAA